MIGPAGARGRGTPATLTLQLAPQPELRTSDQDAGARQAGVVCTLLGTYMHHYLSLVLYMSICCINYNKA